MFTETISCVLEDCPVLSVTVSVTLYVVGTPGGALKVREGFGSAEVLPPSPKFHK